MEAAGNRVALISMGERAVWAKPGVCGEVEIEATLCMRHSNLNAIVASHQDAILCPTQVRDAYRKPDPDGQERKGERECRHIRQHPLPIFALVLAITLVARQVPRYLKLTDDTGVAGLGDRSARPRAKLEHAMLLLGRG
jgi:hypothetical protein